MRAAVSAGVELAGDGRRGVAVAACFVIDATIGMWSSSWSDPTPQRPCGAAPDHDDRRPVEVRRREGADPVRDAGPGRQRGRADAPRHLRPSLRGEAGGLLVARVDESDGCAARAVVEGPEMAAVQGEQRVDAERGKSSQRHVTAVTFDGLHRRGTLYEWARPRPRCAWSRCHRVVLGQQLQATGLFLGPEVGAAAHGEGTDGYAASGD